MNYKEIEMPSYGTWAEMKLSYMKTHEQEELEEMALAGTLPTFLEQFQEEKEERALFLENHIKKNLGVNEDLKARNPREYVGLTNNVKHQVEELMRAGIRHED